MKLHLGVYNIPYTDGNETTGDVAEILEKKYQIMSGFYKLNATGIADDIAKSLNDALFSLHNGANALQLNPFAGATSRIQTKFRQFIETEGLAALGRKGVPTQAALDGRSSRLKGKKGARRPSFRDTGLFEANFTCWVEVK